MSSKTSVLFVNHRNNVVDNRLISKLEEYEKEYLHNITRLDHDKVHLRRVLKDIYKCQSDNDPATKYLEDSTDDVYKTYHQYTTEKPNTPTATISQKSSTRPLPVIYLARQKAIRPITQPNFPISLPKRTVPIQTTPTEVSRGLPNITRSHTKQTQYRRLSTTKSQLPKIDEQTTVTQNTGGQQLMLHRRRTMPIEDHHNSDLNMSTSTSLSELSSTLASEGRKSLFSILTGGHRGRSKSKIEMDLIQRILEERNRRHRANVAQISTRVQRFCKNMEEYTIKQKLEAEPATKSLAF